MFTTPRNLLLYFTVLLCSMRTLWTREIFRLSKLALVLFTVCLMRKKMLQTPQSSCFQCLGWNVLKWVVRGSFQKKGGGGIFSHLSQICLPKTLGQKVVEKIERNGVPSKESLPPSFVKLINKIHKDVSHYWVFLWAGGRKGGTTDFWQHPTCFQTADFFLLLPQERSVKPFIPKKKKKSKSIRMCF